MSSSPCARPKLQDWRTGGAASASKTPVEEDFAVYQSDGFSVVVEVLYVDGTPIDLTGSTVLAQIRKGPADYFPTIVDTFSTVVVLPNQINVSLTPEQTKALNDSPYYYDLQVTFTEDNIPLTLLRGRVLVTLEISRPEVTR